MATFSQVTIANTPVEKQRWTLGLHFGTVGLLYTWLFVRPLELLVEHSRHVHVAWNFHDRVPD
jgi:hypothetical protein